jgi:hypothetical protein
MRKVAATCGDRKTRCTAAVAVSLIFLLAGCVSGSALGGTPASTLSASHSSASTRESSGTINSSTSPSGSSSSRRPARPGSISSFLSSLPFQKGPCTFGFGIAVAAGSSNNAFSVEELSRQPVCLTGLDESGPPTVIVDAPDGAQTTVAATQNQGGIWYWWVSAGPGQKPFDSLGKYTFQVLAAASASPSPSLPSSTPAPSTSTPVPSTSGQQSVVDAVLEDVDAAGSFTITPPPGRSAAIVAQAQSQAFGLPVVIAAGGQLQIALAGFLANSIAYPSIYGPGMPGPESGETDYQPLADLPAVAISANGDALITWQVPPGASAGEYALWISPKLSDCGNRVACLKFGIS